MASTRKPAWLKISLPDPQQMARFREVERQLALRGLHTVCAGARCMNQAECWGRGTATFMILGERCSRNCHFCAVDHRPPLPLEADEPDRVAEAVAALGLRYVVLTSVDRDDLPDSGAAHFVRSVRAILDRSPGTRVEILTGDFQGSEEAIQRVATAGASVLAHNVETVRALSNRVRDPRCLFDRSLEVLRLFGRFAPGVPVKSGFMLGHGETEAQIEETLEALRSAGCDILTLSQYLQPARDRLPVRRYVPPEEFQAWAARAREMGFRAVASGPLVRSSYRAGEIFLELKENKKE